MSNVGKTAKALLYTAAAAFAVFSLFVIIASLSGELTRLDFFSLITRSGNRYERYYPFVRGVFFCYGVTALTFSASVILSADGRFARASDVLFSVFVKAYTFVGCASTVVLATYFFAVGWVSLAASRSPAFFATVGPIVLASITAFILTLAFRSSAYQCRECIKNGTEPEGKLVLFCLSVQCAICILSLFTGGRTVSFIAELFAALGFGTVFSYIVSVKLYFRKKREKRTLYFK